MCPHQNSKITKSLCRGTIYEALLHGSKCASCIKIFENRWYYQFLWLIGQCVLSHTSVWWLTSWVSPWITSKSSHELTEGSNDILRKSPLTYCMSKSSSCHSHYLIKWSLVSATLTWLKYSECKWQELWLIRLPKLEKHCCVLSSLTVNSSFKAGWLNRPRSTVSLPSFSSALNLELITISLCACCLWLKARRPCSRGY